MLCTTCAASSSSFAASAAQELQVNVTTNMINSEILVIDFSFTVLVIYCSNHPTATWVGCLSAALIGLIPQNFRHMAIKLSTDCGGFLRTPDSVRRVVYNRHISIQQESRRSSSGITGCRIPGWSPGRYSPFRIPEYRPDGTKL